MGICGVFLETLVPCGQNGGLILAEFCGDKEEEYLYTAVGDYKKVIM